MRKAIEEYKLIENGDRIAVGVSGGKDSLVLLKALADFKKFNLYNYEKTYSYTFTRRASYDGSLC